MKLTRTLLLIALTAALVGCGAQDNSPSPEPSTQSSAESTPTPSATDDGVPNTDSGDPLAPSREETAFMVFSRVYEAAAIALGASDPSELTVEAMADAVNEYNESFEGVIKMKVIDAQTLEAEFYNEDGSTEVFCAWPGDSELLTQSGSCASLGRG